MTHPSIDIFIPSDTHNTIENDYNIEHLVRGQDKYSLADNNNVINIKLSTEASEEYNNCTHDDVINTPPMANIPP